MPLAGAVGRVLWGWMLRLIRASECSNPHVAKAILSGDPCEVPHSHRVLLATTPDVRIWTFNREHDEPGAKSLPDEIPDASS
jgi:hypothetical protein